MQITLNGVPLEVGDGLTVADLLNRDGYVAERVATMVNGEVAPRDTRSATTLVAGDVVEVVTFAGGGQESGG